MATPSQCPSYEAIAPRHDGILLNEGRLRVSVEKFQAWYAAESDMDEEVEFTDVLVIVLTTYRLSAEAHRVAIVIVDADSETILFKEVVERNWTFYAFPGRAGPLECQLAIHSEALDQHKLYWLQFDVAEDFERFQALFRTGQELAKAESEALLASLSAAMDELRLKWSSVDDEALPPYALVQNEDSINSSPWSPNGRSSPSYSVPRSLDVLIIMTEQAPNSQVVLLKELDEVHVAITRLNCGWAAGLRRRCQSVTNAIVTTHSAYSEVMPNLAPLLRAVTKYTTNYVEDDLLERIDGCRQCCATARTRERELRNAFVQLRPLLDVLAQDEPMCSSRTQDPWLSILQTQVTTLLNERNRLAKEAFGVVSAALEILQSNEHAQSIVERAMATLANIRCSLQAQTGLQNAVLTNIECGLENANSEPNVLVTNAGQTVLITDLHHALLDYEVLREEVNGLSGMVLLLLDDISAIRGALRDSESKTASREVGNGFHPRTRGDTREVESG
ncbi:hypothetical protein C8Q76DRAFT_694908 [Earliella scabrosa]|nr:hypothetical protein C8Q76DRAFT_694908 [Earliella scabrosa]